MNDVMTSPKEWKADSIIEYFGGVSITDSYVELSLCDISIYESPVIHEREIFMSLRKLKKLLLELTKSPSGC